MSKDKMDGAQALIRSLENQGVEYIFGYPGGVVIPIFDALVTTRTKIKLVLVRHEQGAAHIADGYARATGKPGVVLVTSGPGATNTISGIFTAHMDSVPIVVLSGQVARPMIGKDAFQEADIFGITMPIVKHSFLVKDIQDIPRMVKEAFHICQTGRPGPVLIDLPKDVSAGTFEGDINPEMDLPGYTPGVKVDEEAVQKVADALSRSRKPILLLGHGVLISGAWEETRKLAEKLNAPVVTTLLGKGAFPETHPLSLGWMGMHGSAYSNKAVCECDLIMSIGSRFDDRIVGIPSRFAKDAVRIHVDIDLAEMGKLITCHHYVQGDAREVVNALLPRVSRLDTAEWVAHLADYKKKYPLHYKRRGKLKVQHVVDELCRLTAGRAIVVTDVGQHQMWAAQFYKTDQPNSFLCSGGAGTMGYGLPAAIGAQFGRPKDTVCVIVGDGGFQMTMSELATAALHKLPIKIILMNNRYLGMVRQWQELFYEDRKSGVRLEGNPDFVQLCRAYENVRAFPLRRGGDVRRILRKALDYNDGPAVVVAEVEQADNVFPMVPAGHALEDMIIDKPRQRA